MRNEARVGDGTLLPSASNVKQENIDDLRARRAALQAEVVAAPARKVGTEWHAGRVDEIHALTRQIQAAEDAERDRPIQLPPIPPEERERLNRRYHEHLDSLRPVPPPPRIPAEALTLPVTLRLTCGQLAVLAKCCEHDEKRTVGEWIMAKAETAAIALLNQCLDVPVDEARAIWTGKEEA